MNKSSQLYAALWRIVPAKSALLYRICSKYIDQHNGENNSDIYTNGELWLMSYIIPQCRTVFDIGANVGDWSALALAVNPGLNVHCFEPSSQTFANLKARNLRGTILNNFGVSSKAGTMTLYIFADGSGLNSLYLRKGLEGGYALVPQKGREIVQVDTIDGYCQRSGVEFIDFLKVDVEGHELEVFKGAARMLSERRIRRIQFEYGGCNIDSRVLLKDFFEFLVPYGYTFHKLFPRELRQIDRYDQRLENFKYQNWFLVADRAKI